MHKRTIAAMLGAVLSAGMLMAQAQEPASTPQNQPMQDNSAPAHAGWHGHRMNANRQLKHLTKKLNLTADQQAQIKPILMDRAQQMKSLRADSSMSKQDRRAKMREIQQDTKSKLEAVLNDQQKQQFEQMMANHREHRRGMKGGSSPTEAPQPQAQPQS